jgi:hypothetical protein
MYCLILVKVCNDIDVRDHLWMYVMRQYLSVLVSEGVGQQQTTNTVANNASVIINYHSMTCPAS